MTERDDITPAGFKAEQGRSAQDVEDNALAALVFIVIVFGLVSGAGVVLLLMALGVPL